MHCIGKRHGKQARLFVLQAQVPVRVFFVFDSAMTRSVE